MSHFISILDTYMHKYISHFSHFFTTGFPFSTNLTPDFQFPHDSPKCPLSRSWCIPLVNKQDNVNTCASLHLCNYLSNYMFSLSGKLKIYKITELMLVFLAKNNVSWSNIIKNLVISQPATLAGKFWKNCCAMKCIYLKFTTCAILLPEIKWSSYLCYLILCRCYL